VFEQGLLDTLTWVKNEYGNIPLYITENGAAFFDPPVASNGRVRDPLRMDYLQRHIGAVKRAIDNGVDMRGYMVWSLLDNLEWSLGYSKRFGIVHVNYGTQERTPKDSARWYSRVIASHGKSLGDPLPY
jgi:beta-glucosidase